MGENHLPTMCLPKEKDLAEKTAKSLFCMAPQAGFEPATNGLTVRCATAAPLRGSARRSCCCMLFVVRPEVFSEKKVLSRYQLRSIPTFSYFVNCWCLNEVHVKKVVYRKSYKSIT